MYLLWCCGSNCHQPFTFIRIGSGHTVWIIFNYHRFVIILPCVCLTSFGNAETWTRGGRVVEKRGILNLCCGGPGLGLGLDGQGLGFGLGRDGLGLGRVASGGRVEWCWNPFETFWNPSVISLAWMIAPRFLPLSLSATNLPWLCTGCTLSVFKNFMHRKWEIFIWGKEVA